MESSFPSIAYEDMTKNGENHDTINKKESNKNDKNFINKICEDGGLEKRKDHDPCITSAKMDPPGDLIFCGYNGEIIMDNMETTKGDIYNDNAKMDHPRRVLYYSHDIDSDSDFCYDSDVSGITYEVGDFNVENYTDIDHDNYYNNSSDFQTTRTEQNLKQNISPIRNISFNFSMEEENDR